VVIRITTYRKERRYEPREIYRHGRPPSNDLGCGHGLPWHVDHGKLEKGMRPTMARLTLARKIASITLTIWKKGADFDATQLHRQEA
jgi:hypothetical protein